MRTSKAIQQMGRSGIREIFDLASTMSDAIHLEMGEPNFPTPAHIRAAAATAAEKGQTKYTPNAGIPELREALAKKVRERNGIRAEADQVIVTPGAIAALFGTFIALCNPGDEILIPDPAWPNYRMIADLLGLTTRYFPLRPEHDMQPRLESIAPLVTPRTKLIVINSPGNPTGTVISEANLRSLLELAADHDLWVVADEVYDEITFDGPAPSAAAVSDDERVVSVFSFSKTYAMTGWRVGYAVAPPDLAPMVVKTQEPITACVNAPAQWAALAAVTGPQDCVDEMRNAYRARRDRVLEILASADVSAVRPAGAFYVWVNVSSSKLTDLIFCQHLLEQQRVAVTPGTAFGPGSSAFVRVSLASAPEALYEGVHRLATAVRSWSEG